MKARRMKEDFWSFDPTAKLWIASNHRPGIVGIDHGIWRRLRLIPFKVKFWDSARGESGPPHLEMDRSLINKILPDEAPGILAWMVRGCLAWQREGIPEPASVARSTADFRGEQDVVGTFIGDCCTVGPDEKCQASFCYEQYVAWHKRTGLEGHAMSLTKFAGQLLQREGIEKKKDGVVTYYGVSCLPQSHQAGG